MNKLYKLIENIIQTYKDKTNNGFYEFNYLLKVDKSTVVSEVFKNCI